MTTSPNSSRLLILTSKTATLALLFSSLFLTLFILLSPTTYSASNKLTLFSILPTGEQRVNIEPTRGSRTAAWEGKESALAVVLYNKTHIADAREEPMVGDLYGRVGVSETVNGGMWLGVTGPSVYVGVMREFRITG
jgi:hypothetical protein